MTQIFTDKGSVIPATVLSTESLVATQIKTKEKDGYSAIQVGFGKRAEKNISKAVKGHTKGLNLPEGKGFAVLREFRVDDSSSANRGDQFSIDSLAVGNTITVSGISKAKGFQGVVKRHGFHGGPRSHGQKHSEREPGSIGGSGGRAGGRVAKGMRMAGRTGGERITVKNLKIVGLDKDNGIILVSGAVPGRRGTLLEVRG